MKTKPYLLTILLLLALAGCLTSQEPFYTDADIVVDDRIVGHYVTGTNEPPWYVEKDIEHKGHYFVVVASDLRNRPDCLMRFHAVLFQVGTNRFLDMLPQVQACDDVAGGPPSLIGLLESATIQPMHMAVRVEVTTNGVVFGFADQRHLEEAVQKYPDYFQKMDTERFPRMIGDTKKKREFLERFANDTNIFKTSEMKRAAK